MNSLITTLASLVVIATGTVAFIRFQPLGRVKTQIARFKEWVESPRRDVEKLQKRVDDLSALLFHQSNNFDDLLKIVHESQRSLFDVERQAGQVEKQMAELDASAQQGSIAELEASFAKLSGYADQAALIVLEHTG